MRPRRRKALRQVSLGQDRFQAGDRHRQRDDYKLRRSRVRFAAHEDCYQGDYDTGTDYTDRRKVQWADFDVDDESDYGTDASRQLGRNKRPLQHSDARASNRNVITPVLEQLQHATIDDSFGAENISPVKRFVTFYITNFPPQASTFFLRKRFEVCGILEEVFVPNNRNRNGDVYGFV